MKGDNRRSSVVPLVEGIELKIWGDGKSSQFRELERRELHTDESAEGLQV